MEDNNRNFRDNINIYNNHLTHLKKKIIKIHEHFTDVWEKSISDWEAKIFPKRLSKLKRKLFRTICLEWMCSGYSVFHYKSGF